jgi:uncharacterized protein
MEIQNKLVGSKGIFFIQDDEGNIQAEMIYTLPAPDHMIIEHTEVGDELRGQNVGYKLVHHAAEYARHHHMKITPICPFAHSVFKKKPEFSDVWYKQKI